MNLTSKERALLRSQSNNLPDLVYIGKEGVTDNVLKQINDNLFAHELIKVKLQKNTPQVMNEIESIITANCGCEVVGKIGSKLVLYKYTTKKDFKHYLV